MCDVHVSPQQEDILAEESKEDVTALAKSLDEPSTSRPPPTTSTVSIDGEAEKFTW